MNDGVIDDVWPLIILGYVPLVILWAVNQDWNDTVLGMKWSKQVFSWIQQRNTSLSGLSPSPLSISTLNPHAAASQSCSPGILLIQHPGEAGSTLSCFSPWFGVSLCCSSACHSCLGSLFLLAVVAKYKRIAVVDLVSPLRRTQTHRHVYCQSRTAPVGPDTTQTLLPVILGAVLDLKTTKRKCVYARW